MERNNEELRSYRDALERRDLRRRGREQIVFLNCFDLYHKLPNSGARQRKSRY